VATAVCLLRRHRLSVTLIVPAAGWTLLFGFITPEPRFHFALGPVLAILAGAFAIFAWDAVRAAAGSRFYRMSASS
jgi:hypothetical protein